jgi:fused signal recognition particle receptor
VIGQALPGAPHEVLLVLEATVGQNALAQARQFREMVGVTGLALTKLDGTAKGGIVVAIADQLKLPVRLIGVGEGVDDLQDFQARAFVNALLGLPSD